MSHMIREIIQNSLDAHDSRYPDKPVIVRMRILKLTPEMIGSTSLKPHVKSSLEHMKGDQKAEKFYRGALNMLKKKDIPTLEITDENTTGLIDDNWDALIYKEGTPNKEGQTAAGGSYGIGKNAPYTTSALSMVCYSTRYLGKGRVEKFIAKCKLVSHPKPSESGTELQHVGFGTSEGLKDSRFPPILGNAIHKVFRLSHKGSGVFIVGFDVQDWEKTAKKSIARNFFTAIHEKKLQVEVNGDEITNQTLNELDFGDGSYRDYYEIVKSTTDPYKIEGGFGSFEIKIKLGEEIKENRVAYINRRGMLVTEEKSFGKNPFHVRLGGFGKFVATIRAVDDKTDMRIRQMEPPTHESIEYKRISDQKERKNTKDSLREVQDKIYNYIKDKIGIDSQNKSTQLTELVDILPIYSSNGVSEFEKRLNEKVEHSQMSIPKHKSFTVDDMRGDGSNAENGGGNLSGATKNRQGKKGAKKGNTSPVMDDIRVIRHTNTLRVAFTSRLRDTKFVVKPAGEEHKPQDVIPVTAVKVVSPDYRAATLNDSIITVKTERGRRVILDLAISQGETYTGYDIIEYGDSRE